MPSIKTYIDLLERLQSVNVRVDAQRCLAVRNRNIACGRCAQACTSSCISVSNGLQCASRALHRMRNVRIGLSDRRALAAKTR